MRFSPDFELLDLDFGDLGLADQGEHTYCRLVIPPQFLPAEEDRYKNWTKEEVIAHLKKTPNSDFVQKHADKLQRFRWGQEGPYQS
jgi:hypothetical protein